MVPAGEITQQIIDELADRMEPGDIIIDGGNSYYRDDIRARRPLNERGIHLVDCGTSGGVWGLERGYCLMIGGDDDVVADLSPLFATRWPGRGRRAAHARAHRRARPGRAGLAALRAERRRPLRQDGPQRHRVRDDGVPGRGAERAAQRRHRHPQAGGRRGDRAAGRTREYYQYDIDTTAVAEVWRRGSVDRLLAARPDWPSRCCSRRTCPTSRGGSPTPARAAGPRSPRSRRACPRRC